MPPTSDSRQSRSTREDAQSRSKLQTNESATESGSATEEEEVSAMSRFFTPKVVGLVVGALCLAMLILIGIFIGIAVFLSTSVDFNDLTCENIVENIFGPSEEKLRRYNDPKVNRTQMVLPETTKTPTVPLFMNVEHPKLALKGEGVGVDQYLPKVIYPTHYDVHLRINMPFNNKVDFQVGGFVNIFFNVTQNTKRVYFNVLDVDIVRAEDIHHRELKVYNGDHPEVRYVEMLEMLEVGKESIIVLNFKSSFNLGMDGLYYSRYLDSKGQVHYTASTQFESQSARRVFPCLDEPYYRSSFKFVIEHPSSYDAYSNMPNVSRTVLDDGMAITTFQPIPNAPTYILALFLADDYAYISEKATSGTEVRVLTRKEFINDAQESLKYAVKGLDWFNKIFRIPYPHPKLDIAGIVSFEAGAMENYGFTTYRETLVFFNDSYSDSARQIYGKKVILHEFLHQWFGNLVTPVDWSQTFMSEGFARFFETYALLAISGDASKYSIEVALDSGYLLTVDSLNVHPNDYVFRSKLELRDGFDAITYNRASSVFNMIRGFVGDEIFFAALRNYLAANSNGHSHWQKLAAEVQNAASHDPQLSKVDFTAFFEAWFTVPGYPVVNVEKNGRVFTLTASYFSLVSSPIKDSRWGLGEKWPIPIWYRVSSNPSELKRTMMEPGKKLTINVHNDNDVIFVNSEAHGYYLVNYEGALFNQVINGLAGVDSPDLLGANVRFQVDMCPLLIAGYIKPRVFFETIQTLSRAKLLLAPSLNCLHHFAKIVKDTEISSAYAQFMREHRKSSSEKPRNRISDAGLNYYLDAARHFEEYQIILQLECEANSSACEERERYNFEKKVVEPCGPSFVANQTADCVKTEVVYRELTYCLGIKNGKPEWYDLLVKLFINSRNPFEQEILMKGLTCTTNDHAVSKLFTLITTQNDWINKAERKSFFSALYKQHPALTRRLFIKNMKQILSNFPTAASHFLKTVFNTNNEKDYLEILRLLNDNQYLIDRFSHIFRDILNHSRASIESALRNLPGTVEFFKELQTSRVVKDAEDAQLCEAFGSCVKKQKTI